MIPTHPKCISDTDTDTVPKMCPIVLYFNNAHDTVIQLQASYNKTTNA